ncbi:MAG: glycerol-3-phosphate 1-O-acyltransferase PlsY [Actinobacteria bacterium]|nr:glycerol-3-phosphate 1-O-acyltransferase PlsY [Actinomycetota bacterium]
METILLASVVATLSYFVGAIPFALLIGKWFFATDVRNHGSGNLGATNVMRVLGWKAGLAVFLLDAAKGAVCVLFASVIHPAAAGEPMQDILYIGAMIAAVMGHSYSPYIGFRGGKGVATAAGAILVLTPAAWLGTFLTLVAVVAIFKMVSLGSIAAAIVYPVLTVAIYSDRPAIVAMAVLVAVLVIWRHRVNIVRIAKGQESRITDKKVVVDIPAKAVSDSLSTAGAPSMSDEHRSGS